MLHIEGTIHEEGLKCSVASQQCNGNGVEVRMDQMDYDLNGRITRLAMCEECDKHTADEL